MIEHNNFVYFKWVDVETPSTLNTKEDETLHCIIPIMIPLPVIKSRHWCIDDRHTQDRLQFSLQNQRKFTSWAIPHHNLSIRKGVRCPRHAAWWPCGLLPCCRVWWLDDPAWTQGTPEGARRATASVARWTGGARTGGAEGAQDRAHRTCRAATSLGCRLQSQLIDWLIDCFKSS